MADNQKTFDATLKLLGKMDSSFTATMNRANAMMQKLEKQAKQSVRNTPHRDWGLMHFALRTKLERGRPVVRIHIEK